jgi:anti-sigma B factor antagonist
MKITENINDKYVVLSIEGVLSVDNLRTFEKKLSRFYAEKKHILLDLYNVSFIDSASLGIMVLYLTRLEKDNLHIILINVKNDIKEMFAITGVNKLLKIFNSKDEALEFIDI